MFPSVRIGEPLCHDAITVFPLFVADPSYVDYELKSEACVYGFFVEKRLIDQHVVVVNHDQLVLVVRGEMLFVEGRNRLVTRSVLVDCCTTARVPIVDDGRSPHLLRRYEVIDSRVSSHQEQSRSLSLSEQLDECSRKLKYVDQASGLAIAVAGLVLSADIFDKPPICKRMWKTLIREVVLFVFENPVVWQEPTTVNGEDVNHFLHEMKSPLWSKVDPIGIGDEFSNRNGSVLLYDETVLHSSFMAPWKSQ